MPKLQTQRCGTEFEGGVKDELLHPIPTQNNGSNYLSLA